MAPLFRKENLVGRDSVEDGEEVASETDRLPRLDKVSPYRRVPGGRCAPGPAPLSPFFFGEAVRILRPAPMTTANKITLVRILMIPAFVMMALYYGESIKRGEPLE